MDGEAAVIQNSEVHLMCYDIKRPKGDAKFERAAEIYGNNAMGPVQVDAKKEKELCVPSEKIDP